jgi:hypothetical protein
MNFSNPIVGGTSLIRNSIHSPDFITGVQGWTINKDGSVEFSNGTFRGTLVANSLTATSIGASTIQGSDWQGGTMEDPDITFTTSGSGSLLCYGTTLVPQTFTASGSFVVPAGITSLKVQCWSGGGGGQSGSGAGGSGGEYAAENALAVTPGETLTVTVGTGGSGGPSGTGGPGSDGTVSSVLRGGTALVTAHPGKGSIHFTSIAGGTGSTNSIHFNGGSAIIGTAGTTKGGGGGGGSAGTSSGGNSGNANAGITGGNGGAAVTGGAAGGKGGTGSVGSGQTAGAAGSIPGGGGGTGGAGSTSNAAGGTGGRGQVIITYQSAQTLVATVAPAANTDTFSNSSSPQTPEVYHTVPTLQNGWTDRHSVQSTYPVSSYRLMPSGDVEMNLHVVAGTLTTGTLLFTMPAAYIPVHTQIMPVACDTSATPVLSTSGTPLVIIRGSLDTGPGQVQVANLPTNTTRIFNSSIQYNVTL